MRSWLVLVLMCAAAAAITGCSQSITNKDSQGQEIICLGDSITEGVGAGAGEDYPSILGKKLAVEVINAGIRGETTRDGLKRIERDVLQKNPRLVIIEFGANDFFLKIPQEETFKNIDKMIALVQNKGSMAAVAAIKIGILSDGYYAGYKEVAQKRKALLIPDILKGVFDHPEYKFDEIHPNAQGYKLVAERIYQYIKPLMGR